MVGRTLTEIRGKLDGLVTADGRYFVRCGRTGERPVPVDGLRFADRETAVEAVRAAHAYRATLRRYDPRAPWYDFLVCERDAGESAVGNRDWAFPRKTEESTRRAPISYCHDVAGAVFEALSSSDYGDVERAVMDAYLVSAEDTADRDRLCLDLLATMAGELDSLPVRAQRTMLEHATEFLPSVPPSETPVEDAFAALEANALVDGYAVAAPTRLVRRVSVSGYQLPTVDGCLPTLPVVVEALRRSVTGAPLVDGARRCEGGGWELSVSMVDDALPLTCVTVETSG